MNVSYISSDKYAPYLGTSLYSLLDHNQGVCELNIYIFDIDISTENKNKIQSIAERYGRSVVFISQNDRMDEIAREYCLSAFRGTTSHYVKILPNIFLSNLDRVLTLDSDTIITQDLSELYNTNIDDVYLAAVPEITAYHVSSEDRDIIYKNRFYYNCGVLLWNIKKVREDNFSQRYFDALTNYGKQLKLVDQSLLNLTVTDADIKSLHMKYNYNCGLHLVPALREPVYRQYAENGLGFPCRNYKKKLPARKLCIIHFLGGRHPWVKWRFAPFESQFLRYWKKGPWRDTPRESYLDQMIAYKMGKNPSALVGKGVVGRMYAAVLAVMERYSPNLLGKLRSARSRFSRGAV